LLKVRDLPALQAPTEHLDRRDQQRHTLELELELGLAKVMPAAAKQLPQNQ